MKMVIEKGLRRKKTEMAIIRFLLYNKKKMNAIGIDKK